MKPFNKNIYKLFFFIGIVIFLYIFINYLYHFKKEGFITYGNYPCEVEHPLLYGDYPVKQKTKLSNLTSQSIYKYYPVYPSASDKINNIKIWATPNNGLCSPTELCDAYYDKINIIEDIINSPNPEWDSNRVNYYNNLDNNHLS
jgi:hypothetical protein